MKPPKWSWLVPLLLLVTWIGARGLAANPLWVDEWWSIYNAGGAHYGPLSPAGIWTRIMVEDAWQAPGYYIVLSGWGALVGWSAYAGRAFSLLLGVLTIALLYRAGRDLRSHEAGLGAALSLGVCGFFGIYLHEMRAYTVYTFLTVLCVWTYWQLVSCKHPSKFLYVAFLFSVVGLLYTHYFAGLTAVAVGIYHLLLGVYSLLKTRGLPMRWWRLLGLLLCGAILFLPWGSTALNLVMNVQESGARKEFAYDSLTIMLYAGFLFSNGTVGLMAFVALCGLGIRRAWAFVWFMAVCVLLLILLVNTWLPIVNQMRYVMALFPLMALVAGMGVHRLARAGVKPIYIVSVWLATAAIFLLDGHALADIDKPYNYLPWDTFAREMRPYAEADDTGVMLMPYPAYELVQRDVADYYFYGIEGRYEMLESPLVDAEAFDERGRALLADAGRLWVAYDPQQLPDVMAFDTLMLSTHVYCATIVDTPQLHLNMYAPLANDAETYAFGDDVVMNSLLPLSAQNESLAVTLGWHVAADLAQNVYSVALHITDVDENFVTQADYPLPSEAFSCRASFIPVGDLAAGEYSVWAMVYEWQSGARLPTSTAAGAGDRVLLGTFVR